MRRMYSPGSLKVAEVVALPVNVAFGGGVNAVFAAGGLGLLKVTAPGPRNLVHVTETGGRREMAGFWPGTSFASSATHAVISRG